MKPSSAQRPRTRCSTPAFLHLRAWSLQVKQVRCYLPTPVPANALHKFFDTRFVHRTRSPAPDCPWKQRGPAKAAGSRASATLLGRCCRAGCLCPLTVAASKAQILGPRLAAVCASARSSRTPAAASEAAADCPQALLLGARGSPDWAFHQRQPASLRSVTNLSCSSVRRVRSIFCIWRPVLLLLALDLPPSSPRLP